jgi:capsid protein
MPASITQAFVQQWDDTIRLQAQQKESRIVSAVLDRGQITGESFTSNHLAPLDDTPQNTVRHGDTQWSDATHTARIALMQDYYQALPVDRADEPKILANPVAGPYMQSLIAAWNRRQDKVVYAAARATVTLKDATTVALPSTQKIAHGSAGFTKAKLIQCKKMFRANEVDQHNGEELYIMYTADMLEDVLSDTTLTSADFMAVKMLQEGDLSSKWMGFTWIPFEGIDPVSSSTYYTIAWAKSGIHFGRGFIEGKSQRRGDKKDTLQVSMAASVGAVRAEDKKVVEIAYQ